MPALFSVVTPTYNRAQLITEALESVKAQTYRPIEIIVVDDGSTDNTKEVVRAWSEANTEAGALYLRYLYRENGGPGAARNRGLQEIRGEYVQYLDSDDRLHPERFKILDESFAKTGAEFIQTGFEGFCARCGAVVETHYGKPGLDPFELALRGRLWPNTLRSAFRRSLIERSPPWDEAMTCFEDFKYVVSALPREKKSVAIHDVLASARRGDSPRISDRLRTREGRAYRIRCEETLAKCLECKPGPDPEAVREFASRLYGLAFRSAASGWPDLANRCGDLADRLDVPLNKLGRRRRRVYRAGRWAACAYALAHTVKEIFRPDDYSKAQLHKC